MEIEPLRLYVNEALRAPGMSHIPLLDLFWGLFAKEGMPHETNALIKYGYDKRYYQLVQNPYEAEYVVVPHDYWRLKEKRPDLLLRIIEEAKQYQKPLLIDASGDKFGKVVVPNARVLRINQYRFDLPVYEITTPVICEDLLETYCDNVLTIRDKSSVSVVGFTGWASMPLTQRIRTVLKELPVRFKALFVTQYIVYKKGVFWREKAIKIFKRSSDIKTNFIIRSSYSGHAITLKGNRQKNRKEFVQNILESDYTLIVKGDANAATRFYETLSLGRIPVVIDTAMVFPLEDRLIYKDFCVFIDYRDLKNAPRILADFHKALSPEQFKKMQKHARDAFENYLRYDAFSRHLAGILKVYLQEKLR